ncbi:MAG: sigma-70 family RNA polymerase sigma factor [Lachnospiraceae bacterium]|nr:sigma-70 family RNA polymerase sigma factor [Lachnospiraceae bacterium]
MTEGKFEACIVAMNNGDKDGLREVYEEYISYIYGIVRGLLANKEEAEDITSDFFIRLWEKSETYKPGSGHKGWMATIARNMAIDYIRKRKREEPVDFSENREEDTGGVSAGKKAEMIQAGEKSNSVEEQVIADMTIKEALALLKESERRVVHMKIMGQMTFQEIADILEEPMGTVAWRYRQAIKTLRRCGYEEAGN